MKKWLIGSLLLNALLLLLIVGYGYHKRENIIQKIIEKNQKAKIVIFGNSHTARGDWSVLLKRFDVKRSGHGGFSSAQLCRLIQEDIIRFEPIICFVQMGGNDIHSKNFSADTVISNFSKLVTRLREHDIKPVVQSLFYRTNDVTYNHTVDTLNSMLIEFCRSNNVNFLDINSSLNANGPDTENYVEDGIHLSKKGYKIWAKEVGQYLEKRELVQTFI